MTTDSFCFYLQYRLIQTSQTGGQQYSDTSPFSIPCLGQRLLRSLFLRISHGAYYAELELLMFIRGGSCP